MEKEKKSKKFYRRLKNKYRLVILNDDTFEEKVSLRLSPLNLFTIAGLIALFLIVVVTILIAFTPLREFIPGYTDVDLRKNLVHQTLRADSLEKVVTVQTEYMNNINSIVSGRVPNPDSALNSKENQGQVNMEDINFQKSQEDSALRAYVESEEKFSIQHNVNKSVPDISKFYFFPPLKGHITNKYSAEKDHFGIDVVASENEAVKATLDGTVVFSGWTVETGHVIQLQHARDLISVYKHNSVLLKQTGDYVKAGEPIAIIGNSGALTTGPHLHFELWYSGKSIDPEDYIVF